MTTPITPMSAEEAIKNILDFHKIYPMSLKKHVQSALASHLAYVKDKAQKVADNNPEYYNAYAHGFDDCLAVLQSEIDELTK